MGSPGTAVAVGAAASAAATAAAVVASVAMWFARLRLWFVVFFLVSTYGTVLVVWVFRVVSRPSQTLYIVAYLMLLLTCRKG